MQLKNIGLKNKGLKTYDLRRLHPNMRTLQSLSAYFTDFITHNSLLKYGRDIIRLIMYVQNSYLIKILLKSCKIEIIFSIMIQKYVEV